MVIQEGWEQYRWMYAAAGVVSILFGLAAIIWPGLTLAGLVILFAAFAFVDGVLRLITMFRAIGAHQTWWPQLLLGIVGIAAALFILAYPGITALVALYAIAFWAIVIGLLEIVAALGTAEWLLLIVGVISIVFGFVLLGNPAASIVAMVVVIGIFAIVRGIVLLIHSFRGPEVPAIPT
ncbi:MAG TPA: DUF308 domain-containing protein [Chloroflexota bacterium]|nr:DUF308 domain-containing protein [Chloroflexota bacterium]